MFVQPSPGFCFLSKAADSFMEKKERKKIILRKGPISRILWTLFGRFKVAKGKHYNVKETYIQFKTSNKY
jgi:hypothetical protein